MIVKEIPPKEAKEFLLPKHYSGRNPTISQAFGWYDGEELKAVCTFGKPASRNLCDGICGRANSHYVFELNRLCRTEDLKAPLSAFVAECLKRVAKNDWIVVSYSDTAMHHCGYIYQACNFIYTGKTKERSDIYGGSGKHSRHYTKGSNMRVLRSAKHRYVYFCTKNKRLKKEWKEQLNYPIESYPKEQNQNYILGDYLKQIVYMKEKNNDSRRKKDSRPLHRDR